MQSKTIFKRSVIMLGIAAMFLAAGCATKKPQTEGGYPPGFDPLGPGSEILTGDDLNFDETLAMGGARFDSGALPRVAGANFSPVYFGYDNYQIPAEEYAKIDAVINFMQSNERVVLVVEGHCDERGTNEYNLSLGEYRAQSVRAYLANAGIAADRVQTTSYGEERPAVSGSGESVWRLNRRGEFALYQR